MKKRKATYLIPLLLFLSMLGKAQTTRTVPGQYSSIQAAVNASSSGDTVLLTSKITERTIIINKDIVLMGTHPDSSIIIGNGTYSHYISRIITVIENYPANYFPQYNVVIQNITLKEGSGSWHCSLPSPRDEYSFGGAILNNGNLKLINCILKNNQAGHSSQWGWVSCYGKGGAIFNYGDLNILNCVIDSNYTGDNGGAIYNLGNVNCKNTIFVNNRAYKGGVVFNYGNCNFSNSLFEQSDSYEGSVLTNFGTALFDSCLINKNTYDNYGNGSTIRNFGDLFIYRSEISNNLDGDDYYNESCLYNEGVTNIFYTTFAKNSNKGANGGAIDNNGEMLIYNSTFSENYSNNSSTKGGAIYNSKELSVVNSTFTGNKTADSAKAHGIYNKGTLKLKNNILSGNFGSDIINHPNGTVTSYGYNLIQSPGNVIFNSMGDTTGVDAKLDSLRYNGGFTPTCALLPGSPAIGQGHNVDIDGNQVLTDQRGYYRPNPPDIGAFQSNICMATAYQEEITACTGTLDFNAMTVEIMDTNQVQTQNLYQYSFSLDSTTNPNDVVKAYLVFDNKLIGDTVFQPNDTFSFSDRFTLNKGINTFHLIYQVSYNAFPGNYLDAACLSIKKDSQNIVTGVTHPLRKTYIQIQPIINLQPIGKYVCYGDSNAIFVSTNNPSFQNFQWFRNNKKIDGANDTILHLKNISSSDNYFVKVTNSCTSIFSDTIRVNCKKPDKPKINVYGDRFLCPGQFTVLEANNGDSFLWSNNETGRHITINKTQKVYVQAIDTMGCISERSNTISIKKIDSIPKPVLDTVKQTDFCEGRYTKLTCNTDYFMYIWSNSSDSQTITINESGNYSVVGRNRYFFENNFYGCDSEPSDTIVINFHKNPEKPKINVNGKTELCWEETTILEAPTGFDRYFWSRTEGQEYLQISSAGKFVLVLEDSNHCQSPVSDTVEIKVYPRPEAPTVEIDGDSAFCEGGKTLLKTTTHPAYKWNTGDTTQNLEVTEKGYYSVSIFDSNNCQSGYSNAVFIDVFPKPEKPVLNYSGLVEICDGDSIELHAIKNELKYLWNTTDTASNLWIKKTGKFNLQTISEHNCKSEVSDTTEIKVYPIPPTPEIIISNGDSLKSNIRANTYYWFLNGWDLNKNHQSILAEKSGQYQLIVQNKVCFSDTSKPVNFILTSIENNHLDGISVFPNPVTNKLFIKSEKYRKEISNIRIFNIAGKQISNKYQVTNFGFEIDFSGFDKGVYFVEILMGDRNYIYKVVKN